MVFEVEILAEGVGTLFSLVLEEIFGFNAFLSDIPES